MTKFLLLLTTAILATTGVAFLRKVKFPAFSNMSADSVVTFLTQSNLWIGVFFSGFVFLLYIWILTRYETSAVMPMLLGLNLAVVSIFSILFFGEAITLSKLAAYALIFGGMLLLI